MGRDINGGRHCRISLDIMRLGILYAALAYTCWGLLPIYFRVLSDVSAIEIILHRTLWSLAFVVVALMLRRRWTWVITVSKQPRLIGVFAVSALLLAANWLVYVWAINSGHVIDASLGYFILPLINVAIGVVFLRERPRPVQWLAVAVALLGMLWLAWQAGRAPWIGLFLALAFGFYGLLRKTAQLGSLEGLALETALLAPLAAVWLGWWGWTGQAVWPNASSTLLWWLLAAGPITAIPLLLFAAGARRISLTTLGVLQYIGPTLQFVCGVWLFGESVPPERLAGFVIIWIALALFTLEGLTGWRRLRPGTGGS